MAARRRAARKLALNILFEREIGGGPLDRILDRHRRNPGFAFAKVLVQGVQEHQAEIDDLLSEQAAGWTLERMPPIDRILMRLALFEMRYLEDIPKAVSINEAVELAKIYSTEESGAFINGVLGSFLTQPGS